MSTPAIQVDESKILATKAIPSLRSNFVWTFVGNVLYAGCQWGMLSVLAKLGSPTIVGQFTLGLAICAPVFMFTNLQLRVVQATDVNAECEFMHYFTLRIIATVIGLLAIAAFVPFVIDSSVTLIVILLVAVSKCVECMSDVTAGLLQREERLKQVAISLMFRGCGSVLVFSVIFARFRNLALSVAAMSAVWLTVLLLYDLPNARALTGPNAVLYRFDSKKLRRLAMLGLPLGWVATLSSLNANIPRYFLQHYLGLAEQGIYASLAYLMIAIGLVVYALIQSVTTRLARLFADGEISRFVRLLTMLSMLGVLMSGVGVPLALFVGRPILSALYRPEYAEHVDLLAVLVGASGVTTIGAFLYCGMNAARLFRQQVPVYIAASLACVLGSAIFIPRFGLVGAAYAVLLSASTIVVAGFIAMRKAIKARSATAEPAV